MKTWQLLTLVGATLVGAILLNLFLLVAGGQPVGENVLEPGFDDNYVMETLRGRWEDIVLALSIAGVIAIFLALRLVAFLEGFADAPTVVDDDRPDAALLALWKEWVPLMDQINDSRTSDDEAETPTLLMSTSPN